MTRDNYDDDETRIGDKLRRLLERLDNDGSISEHGTVDGDRYSIDLDVEVHSLDDAMRSTDSTRRRSRRPRRSRSTGDDQAHSDDDTDDYAVSLREEDGGVTVTIDLGPGHETGITADVDDDELVVRDDDDVLATVPLPVESGTIRDQSLNNGMFVVQVHPEQTGGDDA